MIKSVDEVRRGDVLVIGRWAIGNPRAARIRVEYVLEIRTDTKTPRVCVEGYEITKAGRDRTYFGRHRSLWRAWLAIGDFTMVERKEGQA